MLALGQRTQMAGIRRAGGRSAQRLAGHSRRRVFCGRTSTSTSVTRSSATFRSAALSRMQPTETKLFEKVAHGSAIPADTDQQPHYSWAYTDDVVHYPYDPAKAKRCLDADGWKVGPGGITRQGRSAPRVHDEHADRIEQRKSERDGLAAAVAGSRRSGRRQELSDQRVFRQLRRTASLQGGHYDVALFGWVGAADPDDSPIYSGDNLAPHGQNAMFWNNRLATNCDERCAQDDRPGAPQTRLRHRSAAARARSCRRSSCTSTRSRTSTTPI